MPVTEKPLENKQLLLDIQKSIYSLHRRQDELIKRLDSLTNELSEFKNSMPTRKSGWFNDYWDMTNIKKK